MTKSPKAPGVVRCAVYTRKSTEEGLEQEFNSLHAQRESAEAYIKSQKQAGWVCLPEHYDDGGFTGGNLDRPALKRLLTDIDKGLVDSVITYKVDRLSRSLLDFARIMETFEKQQVAFVQTKRPGARDQRRQQNLLIAGNLDKVHAIPGKLDGNGREFLISRHDHDERSGAGCVTRTSPFRSWKKRTPG